MQRSSLFFYENRDVYLDTPQNSVNTRPIRVSGYSAVPHIATDSTPMRIILQPPALTNSKDALELRCDTEEELQQWLEAFRRARVHIVVSDVQE